VNDDKLSTEEQEVFSKIAVGDDSCPSAIDSLLNKSGIQKEKWCIFVVTKE
jgi:hypothetical protein